MNNLILMNKILVEQGAASLASEIGNLTNMTTLDLNNNAMNNFGFGYMLGNFSQLKLLKSVNLRGNNVSNLVKNLPQILAFVRR